MTPDDKSLEALFNAAVAGQERLESPDNEDAGAAEIAFDSDAEGPDGVEEIVVPAADQDLGAGAAEDGPPAAAETSSKKSAADAITEALIKAKQEAVEALLQTQAEAKSLRDRLLRVSADFENFRKRTRKQQDEMRQFAVEGMLRELLPVLDNFERAIEHVPADSEDPVVQGVRMVQQQLVAVIAKAGATGFSALQQGFDPARHEAVEQLVTDEHPAGMVVREYQKGYMLHDRLLRPAMVVVAMPATLAPAPVASAGDAGDPDADGGNGSRGPEGDG
ncbi:MAG: nucleotide exchange factor GrpE [Pseudomonadota bacterium]